jgi:hypothetical protein
MYLPLRPSIEPARTTSGHITHGNSRRHDMSTHLDQHKSVPTIMATASVLPSRRKAPVEDQMPLAGSKEDKVFTHWSKRQRTKPRTTADLPSPFSTPSTAPSPQCHDALRKQTEAYYAPDEAPLPPPDISTIHEPVAAPTPFHAPTVFSSYLNGMEYMLCHGNQAPQERSVIGENILRCDSKTITQSDKDCEGWTAEPRDVWENNEGSDPSENRPQHQLQVRIDAEVDTGTHSENTDGNLTREILQEKLATSGLQVLPPSPSSINDVQGVVKSQDEWYYLRESSSTKSPLSASISSTSYQMDTPLEYLPEQCSSGKSTVLDTPEHTLKTRLTICLISL